MIKCVILAWSTNKQSKSEKLVSNRQMLLPSITKKISTARMTHFIIDTFDFSN